MYYESLNNTTMRDSMYPIPKVYINPSFFTYTLLQKNDHGIFYRKTKIFYRETKISLGLPITSKGFTT